MERLLKSPPWWAWFSLLGLEVPAAAIAWAYALSCSQAVVSNFTDLYLFLFVAVWCVGMMERLLKAFHNGAAADYSDECRFFARRHCFVFAVLVIAALSLSIWMLFWHLGVVIIYMALLPAFFSLLFLRLSLGGGRGRVFSLRFIAVALSSALAFATGACIPAFFYDSLFSILAHLTGPAFYLTVLLLLSSLIRRQWLIEESAEDLPPEEKDKWRLCWMLLLPVFVGYCLFMAHGDPDAWIYYGLAMSAAFMFALDRLKSRLSPLMLYTLSWAGFSVAMLIAGVMEQA